MSAAPAQLVMALAIRRLPNDSEWAEAMQAEFDTVRSERCPPRLRNRRPLGWVATSALSRQRAFYPRQPRTHSAVVGPIATFHTGYAVSASRCLLTGRGLYRGMLIAPSDTGHAPANAYHAATPITASRDHGKPL